MIQADIKAGVRNAIDAARFASKLSDQPAVLFKAHTREQLVAAAPQFLDGLDLANINVVPVLQNHMGTCISTLDDFIAILDEINDPRMKAVLEVGHFQRVGTHWREAWSALGDRIALIHVNDIRDGQSVLFGTGDVDFSGLMAQVKRTGFAGNIVVELELASRETDPASTMDGLRSAIHLLCDLHDQPS